tara:strand:- start:1115 stop:1798 length:684 start_codon:yes stop_codon:yes gene_type:complete
MKRFFFIIIAFFVFFQNPSIAHVEHYKGLKLLKYDLYFNDELIGKHIFTFKKKGKSLIVYGNGDFKVSKLGVVLIDFKTDSKATFDNGILVNFTSKTTQNDKKKFVKVNLVNDKKFEVNGSSYVGEADIDSMIGSWWNHEIVKTTKQISPISGRVINQKVNFLGKKKININNENYECLNFHFLSNDKKPNDKKKINIKIWYDVNTLLWIKAEYQKFGRWEYRLSEVK